MNTYYVAGIPYSDELFHHGIKGQRWGIRRYQNPDGSLTPEGKRKYGTIENYRKLQSIKAKNNSSDRKSKISSFISKHKKGIAIAGGLLVAGTAAIAISKIAKTNAANNGASVVEKLLSSKDGYNPKGTVFSVNGNKGTISGYFSPEYANFMRNMNKGSLPGSHAPSFASTTKEFAQFYKRINK